MSEHTPILKITMGVIIKIKKYQSLGYSKNLAIGDKNGTFK